MGKQKRELIHHVRVLPLCELYELGGGEQELSLCE